MIARMSRSGTAIALVVGVCLGSLLATAPAAAQTGAHDLEAHALLEDGRVAFIDERFEDALGHFRRAHELSDRPELLYNIAASLDRLDREAEALSTFQQYLVELPQAPNREDVELRIRVLEAHVAAAAARAAHVEAPPDEDPEVAAIEARLAPETTIEVGGLEDAPPPARGGDVTSEAWFWVVLSVAVLGVAGGVTAGVLASQDPGYRPYSSGDHVVMTLTGSF